MLAKLKCSAARYNAENTPEKCMDGTRVDTINEIVGRLTARPDPNQRLVILSGSAGSGKSTVAKSVASLLAEDKDILAASFFFSRDFAERNNLKLLPSTLARQLADHDAHFQDLLVKFLDQDRTGILSADPRLQFQKLVVELLAQMPPLETPWIICLDALDECGADHGQRYLRWLSDSIAQIPVHVRFFMTGRPDIPRYLKFDSLHSLTHEIVLDDIDPTQVKHDIHLYVEKSLDGSNWITRDPWKISTHDVEEITNRADGLFIFAATTIHYVLSKLPQEHPQRSIDYLFMGAPLSHLHDLYYRVIDEAIKMPHPEDPQARDYCDRAKRVLGTIIHLQEPLAPKSLAALLEMDTEELNRTLLPLSAVIHIPDTTDGGAIRIRHVSFREFITSSIQKRRPDLLCGTEAQQHAVLSDIFRVLQNEVKFNICDLPTSYLRNVDIPDIKERIQMHIPGHLQYASCFWVDHLTTQKFPDNAQTAGTFLLKQFLFWLEIMSLLGMVSHGQLALSKFITWAKEVWSFVIAIYI